MNKENLTKVIAENSIYSRRKAEELIRSKRVLVNDKMAQLGEKVFIDDEIKVNGQKVIRNKKIYIKLNKPAGYVCTNKNFKGEKNIFSLINIKEKVSSIGRLDKDSSGLLILTNDGDLNYKLSHPKFEHNKTYLVIIKNNEQLKNKNFLSKLKNDFIKGINIGEKTLAKAKKIEVVKDQNFKIILSEGKKRQIRRMFDFFDLKVESLKRTEFTGIKLDGLKEGQWKNLSKEEVEVLKKL
ncbi:MAG TPA: pseudouridine synthase [bacterium]|nr:pseudouridine synthase [bacterium]HPV65791.1 pseudouridine synthase [bacterium]